MKRLKVFRATSDRLSSSAGGIAKLARQRGELAQLVEREKLSEDDFLLFRNLRSIRNANEHVYPGRLLSGAEVPEFSGFVDLLKAKFAATQGRSNHPLTPRRNVAR